MPKTDGIILATTYASIKDDVPYTAANTISLTNPSTRLNTVRAEITTAAFTKKVLFICITLLLVYIGKLANLTPLSLLLIIGFAIKEHCCDGKPLSVSLYPSVSRYPVI
jgi:hypothetical protein